MPTTSPFHNQRFIVLETYRKNGTPIVTPLGFVQDDSVQDGSVLYARTTADSGKVKRIRRNPHVRVAPGTGGGQPLGAWVEATAAIVGEPEASAAERKVRAKYRFLWVLITSVDSLRNRLRGRPQPEWVSLRITLASQS